MFRKFFILLVDTMSINSYVLEQEYMTNEDGNKRSSRLNQSAKTLQMNTGKMN